MVYNKYKNKKIEIDNIKFDSEMESKFYQKAKEFNIELGMRKTFILQSSFVYKNKKILPIKYVSDFDIGKYIIDIKGMKTTEFKLKEKIFKYQYGKDYELVCICLCPKKYLDSLDNNIIWEKLGFIELDKLQKLRKEGKKKND